MSIDEDVTAEKTSSLQSFLEQEWPQWREDDFIRAYFKAFTGQKQDWEVMIAFWKDAILKVARHLDLLVINTDDVQKRWFLRDGWVPLGLRIVLTCGAAGDEEVRELEGIDQFVGSTSSTIERLTSLLRGALGWVGLVDTNDGYTETDVAIEDKLVVQSIVQEKAAGLLQTILENQVSSVCIATSEKIKEMCGGAENAEIIIGYLVRQDRAKFITVLSNDRIQGFKFSMTGNQKLTVSDNDRHVLQLYWTSELLQSRFLTFESKLSKLKAELIRVAKAGERRDALRRLRNFKTLQGSRDQCAAFINKIEHVLTVIADAETSKKVTEALRVGAAAIKENHVSLEDVHSCLDELDEAIQVQRETESALVNQNLSNLDEDEASFEEELAALEKEMSAEDDIVDLPSVPNTKVTLSASGETVSSQQTDDDVELEREFSKLALELA